MNPFLLLIVAGASSLLLTYNPSRGGEIVVALLIIAVIGAASGAIAMVSGPEQKMQNLGFLVAAFVVGVLLSETAVFARYYFRYGYQDPKLPVGIAVSLIEFGVISIIGSFALIVTTFVLKRRITRRLSRRRDSVGE